MAYALITHTPGSSLADYRALTAIMGDDVPEGLVAQIAGDADGALHVVGVWESRASADRFVAERLMPAFQQAGLGTGPQTTYVAFDTDDVSIHKTIY